MRMYLEVIPGTTLVHVVPTDASSVPSFCQLLQALELFVPDGTPCSYQLLFEKLCPKSCTEYCPVL